MRCGSEAWEGNKSQAGSLEYIILDSSKTCNEAVRGDMGLETLQSRRDRAKLKWWYKLATLPEDRYHKQLFNYELNIKGVFYIGGCGCVLCKFIELVKFAHCTFIFALRNIAPDGYLDTRRNI